MLTVAILLSMPLSSKSSLKVMVKSPTAEPDKLVVLSVPVFQEPGLSGKLKSVSASQLIIFEEGVTMVKCISLRQLGEMASPLTCRLMVLMVEPAGIVPLVSKCCIAIQGPRPKAQGPRC